MCSTRSTVDAFRSTHDYTDVGATTYNASMIDFTDASTQGSSRLAEQPAYLVEDLGRVRPPGAGLAGEGGATGKEKWAFIPAEFLNVAKQTRLMQDTPYVAFGATPAAGSTPKDYMFDGSAGLFQSRAQRRPQHDHAEEGHGRDAQVAEQEPGEAKPAAAFAGHQGGYDRRNQQHRREPGQLLGRTLDRDGGQDLGHGR